MHRDVSTPCHEVLKAGQAQLPFVTMLGLVLVALACARVEAPKESDAIGWYAARDAEIQSIEQSLRVAMQDIPAFGLAEPPCESEESRACTAERIEILNAQNDHLQRFQREVLPSIGRRHGLLGIDLTYRLPEETQRNVLGHVGGRPSRSRGTVLAEDGVVVDERQIGWGLYQDPGRDNEIRPGFEVVWEMQFQDARVEVALWMWAD